MNRVMVPHEAAEYMGVPEQDLYRWAMDGLIPCVEIAEGVIRYSASAIDAWVACDDPRAAALRRALELDMEEARRGLVEWCEDDEDRQMVEAGLARTQRLLDLYLAPPEVPVR